MARRIPDWEYPLLAAKQAAKEARRRPHAHPKPHGGKIPQPNPKPGQPPATPPTGHVTIYSIDPWGFALTALLGDSPPNPSGGGGGMQSTTMPGAIPASVYTGPAQLAMDLPLVIDNFSASVDHPGGGLNANDELTRINALYGLSDRSAPPPVCKVLAAGSVVLHQWAQWTIVDVTYGEGETNIEDNRSRQAVVLHLEEFRTPDLIGTIASGSVPKSRGSKHHKANKTPRGVQHVTVHKGQTLQDVAYSLGMQSWRPLAAAQHPPITDPRSVKVGQVLRLPKGYGAIEVVKS